MHVNPSNICIFGKKSALISQTRPIGARKVRVLNMGEGDGEHVKVAFDIQVHHDYVHYVHVHHVHDHHVNEWETLRGLGVEEKYGTEDCHAW